MNDDELQGKYWICDECAKKKYPGADPGICTATHGRCGWCKSDDVHTLIPCIDYEGLGD